MMDLIEIILKWFILLSIHCSFEELERNRYETRHYQNFYLTQSPLEKTCQITCSHIPEVEEIKLAAAWQAKYINWSLGWRQVEQWKLPIWKSGPVNQLNALDLIKWRVRGYGMVLDVVPSQIIFRDFE